jgi:hypothetical protein
MGSSKSLIRAYLPFAIKDYVLLLNVQFVLYLPLLVLVVCLSNEHLALAGKKVESAYSPRGVKVPAACKFGKPFL